MGCSDGTMVDMCVCGCDVSFGDGNLFICITTQQQSIM